MRGVPSPDHDSLYTEQPVEAWGSILVGFVFIKILIINPSSPLGPISTWLSYEKAQFEIAAVEVKWRSIFLHHWRSGFDLGPLGLGAPAR